MNARDVQAMCRPESGCLIADKAARAVVVCDPHLIQCTGVVLDWCEGEGPADESPRCGARAMRVHLAAAVAGPRPLMVRLRDWLLGVCLLVAVHF